MDNYNNRKCDGAPTMAQTYFPDNKEAAAASTTTTIKRTIQQQPTLKVLKEGEEEILYDFPSFPNLSLEERRILSQTAFIIFYAFNNTSVRICDIHYHLENISHVFPSINVRYFGPYGTTLTEFVQLPEIACILYPTRITDMIHKSNFVKFRSHIKNLTKFPIHQFRYFVVQCFKEAAEKGLLTQEFGILTLKSLCSIFNSHSLRDIFGEALKKGQNVQRFENLSVMEALCCFCSQEIAIRLASDTEPIKLRLRNHPTFLHHQIEKDRLLAIKAIEFFKAYAKQNIYGFDWNILKVDEMNLGNTLDLTFVSHYPSSFIDNVFAAINYCENVHDFDSLCTTIRNYTRLSLDQRKRRNITEKSNLNLLIEMVSPEALEAVEQWADEKKNVYMKIANELAEKLDKVDREFVVDFINIFPTKSSLLGCLRIWAIRRMAFHILLVTQQPTFISKEDIIAEILFQFKYNLSEWLEMIGIETFEELFENDEIRDMLAAVVIIKKEYEVRCYRNMVSIMGDKNLVLGFPFSTRKELLNSLEQGLLMEMDEDDYITESVLFQLYEFCYNKYLFPSEKRKLFGGNDSLQEFLDEFDVKEISYVIYGSGERAYCMNSSFAEAYQKVIEEKKKCLNAVKIFLGMVEKLKKQKMEGPISNFTAWKKNENALNYELKVYMETHRILSKVR